MSPLSIKTKLLTLFVLTFLCLNAGAAVCLAYCQGTFVHASEEEHCPLAKNAADCPHAGKQMPADPNRPAAESNAVSCCTLAVNIFAAPLERRQVPQDVAAVLPAEPVVAAKAFVPRQVLRTEPARFAGRLADGQQIRLKNCVFRI
jgi:hypothetical protein